MPLTPEQARLYVQACQAWDRGCPDDAARILADQPDLLARLERRNYPVAHTARQLAHFARTRRDQHASDANKIIRLAYQGQLTEARHSISRRRYSASFPNWPARFERLVVEENLHDWTVSEVLARGYLTATDLNVEFKFLHWTPEDREEFERGLRCLKEQHDAQLRAHFDAERQEQNRRQQIIDSGTFLRKDLLARGRTAKLIADLLGGPDVIRNCSTGSGRNRHDYSEHHYQRRRVHQAEKEEAFAKMREWRAQAPARKLEKARRENSRELAENIKQGRPHPVKRLRDRYERVKDGVHVAEPEGPKNLRRRRHRLMKKAFVI